MQMAVDIGVGLAMTFCNNSSVLITIMQLNNVISEWSALCREIIVEKLAEHRCSSCRCSCDLDPEEAEISS